MRATVVIAAHNEGDLLARTIQSCLESSPTLDFEIVVADDHSTDGAVARVARDFPHVRVVQHGRRLGASPTKALGADAARGQVLVFLDGHTKPEPGAIDLLVAHVENCDGQAIITPKVSVLDVHSWQNELARVGSGYAHDLLTFDSSWVPESRMRPVDLNGQRYLESPGLIGCALAVDRTLYQYLWGFDRGMRSWGVEDLDFGLKCWLMGKRILHAPDAVVGHRFRKTFDNYSVPYRDVIFNKLRMARKTFTDSVWTLWTEYLQAECGKIRTSDHPEGAWAHVWQLFEQESASVEAERAYLHSCRVRDEFWFANQFDLSWPRLPLSKPAISWPLGLGVSSSPPPSEPPQSPSVPPPSGPPPSAPPPSPSPSP